MSLRGLLRLGAAFAAALLVACLVVRAVFHLDPDRAPGATRVVSLWRNGVRFAQRVVQGDASDVLRTECGAGCTRIIERIVDDGPLLVLPLLSIGVSLAAGRDGVYAEHGGRSTYLTQNDLLSRQHSREGAAFGEYKLRIGVDNPSTLLAELASGLGTDTRTLLAHGRLRRFVARREDEQAGQWPRAGMDAARVDLPELQRAIRAAARYLVLNQQRDGRFFYELDARGRPTHGYNWPRHGGTTLFLAEAAAYTRDPVILRAAVLAARHLQRSATVACGPHRCIGDEPHVNAGSAALGLLAYQALVAQGAGDALRSDLESLAAFLRSLQRPDGELMHIFDRNQGRAIDVQLDYYTGEAAFALARTARVTHSAADLHAASAALAHLVDRRFSLVRDRYDFISHHWTCQALFELWDRAPDQNAFDFCLDYQQWNRGMQVEHASALGDYAGGYARDPYFPPRLTPAASRAEGAAATLATAIAARSPQRVIDALERDVRGAIAFMLRFQYLPGPLHLFASPLRMQGGVPASPTDLSVRIDYPQHAAGAMLRYALILEERARNAH